MYNFCFQLPLCDMDTEKSQLEDLLLRSLMQNALAKKLDKKGVDVEQYREKADKDIKQNLMKLFAVRAVLHYFLKV